MAELLTFQSLLALVSLAGLEIVLGVDNLVFIAIVTGRMSPGKRAAAQRLGLGMAAFGRIAFLMAASWAVTLQSAALFTIDRWDLNITIRDIILIAGGVFLLIKGSWEIYETLDKAEHADHPARKPHESVAAAIFQILLLDLVFSIDSVLTAIGVVRPQDFTSAPIPGTTVPWPAMAIMSAAVLAAVAVMIWFIGPVGRFINRHVSVKMLALAFILLIGVVLIADGFGQHIPRGYIYFAMAFSVFVETLNLKMR